MKILLVENRDVGFFSGLNRIIGALVTLKSKNINLNDVSISWNNRLYQNDVENLFAKYIAPTPSLHGDETTLLAADLVGDVMGAFMDSSTSDLCRSVLNDLNYFQSHQYLERYAKAVVKQEAIVACSMRLNKLPPFLPYNQWRREDTQHTAATARATATATAPSRARSSISTGGCT
jgi:hypothetical protein